MRAVELNAFIGEWRDSMGNKVSVSWARPGNRGGQLNVELIKPSGGRTRLNVKQGDDGRVSCGHYTLDDQQSQPNRIVWADYRNSRRVSVWERDGPISARDDRAAGGIAVVDNKDPGPWTGGYQDRWGSEDSRRQDNGLPVLEIGRRAGDASQGDRGTLVVPLSIGDGCSNDHSQDSAGAGKGITALSHPSQGSEGPGSCVIGAGAASAAISSPAPELALQKSEAPPPGAWESTAPPVPWDFGMPRHHEAHAVEPFKPSVLSSVSTPGAWVPPSGEPPPEVMQIPMPSSGSTSDASVLAAQPQVDPHWRAAIEAFYQRFNPDKLPELDKILAKYRGGEAALYQALVEKYVPQSPHPQPPWGMAPAWGPPPQWSPWHPQVPGCPPPRAPWDYPVRDPRLAWERPPMEPALAPRAGAETEAPPQASPPQEAGGGEEHHPAKSKRRNSSEGKRRTSSEGKRRASSEDRRHTPSEGKREKNKDPRGSEEPPLRRRRRHRE